MLRVSVKVAKGAQDDVRRAIQTGVLAAFKDERLDRAAAGRALTRTRPPSDDCSERLGQTTTGVPTGAQFQMRPRPRGTGAGSRR